jgi:hypothetical protein
MLNKRALSVLVGLTATALVLAALTATALVLAGFRGESGPRLPDLTPFDPALTEQIHDIRNRMVEVRELDTGKIEEGTLSREALTQYYEEWNTWMREQEGADMEAWNVALRLLHMIDADDDLLDLLTAHESADILGFYSPTDNKLALVTEEAENISISMSDRLVLAHEYVHSFQDARFDLAKLHELEDEDGANTNYGTTVECLIEGDAMLATLHYVVEKLDREQQQALLDEWAKEEEESPDEPEFPPALERYTDFPYDECTDFVQYLFDDGRWSAVNRAYENVPVSSEQILHPEKYLDGEKPLELELPDLSDPLGAGWEQLDDSMFGEFDVYNYVLTSLEDREEDAERAATYAADGWGGGRIAIYSTDDTSRVVIHLRLEWDTQPDSIGFFNTFLYVAGLAAGRWWEPRGELEAVRWDATDEYGYATWGYTSFTAVIATNEDDLRRAVSALDLDLDEALAPTREDSSPPE